MQDEQSMTNARMVFADEAYSERAKAAQTLGEDFDLVVCSSGEQAWAQINADPDVMAVFAALSMPGMDGFDLLERVRSDERDAIRELPVVVISGEEGDGVRQQALSRGATDFLGKPIDSLELSARAQAYATRDRLRRRAQLLEQSQLQDPVTGLGNSAYVERRLRSALAYALRHRLPTTVMHVDIQGLDAVVRHQGMDEVQQLLRHVGQAISSSLREEDVVGRIAKARFSVLCPNTPYDGASIVAHRLLRSVESAVADVTPETLDVVVGAYVADADALVEADDIDARADEAADEAEAQGPGSVVVEHGQLEAMAPVQAGASTRGARSPSLDEAVRMLDADDVDQRLGPYWRGLLERVVALFAAAPREVADEVLEQCRAALAEGDDRTDRTPP